MRIAGWMPLKQNSTRLPGKNWRKLGGKPLFWHMLETLNMACDEVFINTDIADIETNFLGANAPYCTVIRRKHRHCEPTLSPVNMLVDDLDTMAADVIVYAHATIPLLEPETLRSAIQFFVDNYPRCDSVVSVTRLQERFYNEHGEPLNFNVDEVIPLQDFPPTYLENSAFFVMASMELKRLKRRVGDRPYMYEVDKDEAVEIDDEQDFRRAEYLLAQRGSQPDMKEQDEAYTAKIVNKFDLIMNAGRIVE